MTSLINRFQPNKLVKLRGMNFYTTALAWSTAPVTISKLFLYFFTITLDGCPCPAFDCNLLDQLADSCLDLSENQNWLQCKSEANSILVRCSDECADQGCSDACTDSYELSLKNCPCGTNCKGEIFYKISVCKTTVVDRVTDNHL